MKRSAIISDCGTYRYYLQRASLIAVPVHVRRIVFCMLNPSKADASIDDPTAKRVMGFAIREGAEIAGIVNAYGLRATDPAELKRHPDPIGPRNDAYLNAAGILFDNVVVAWGKHVPPQRAREVVEILTRQGARLWCLGTNKDGSPKHPLYLPSNAPLTPWSPNV